MEMQWNQLRLKDQVWLSRFQLLFEICGRGQTIWRARRFLLWILQKVDFDFLIQAYNSSLFVGCTLSNLLPIWSYLLCKWVEKHLNKSEIWTFGTETHRITHCIVKIYSEQKPALTQIRSYHKILSFLDYTFSLIWGIKSN